LPVPEGSLDSVGEVTSTDSRLCSLCARRLLGGGASLEIRRLLRESSLSPRSGDWGRIGSELLDEHVEEFGEVERNAVLPSLGNLATLCVSSFSFDPSSSSSEKSPRE
jgi:hypothetical protein